MTFCLRGTAEESSSGGPGRITPGGSGMASNGLAMGTSRSAISHGVTIWCAVLASLYYALTLWTSKVSIVPSDMSNADLLRIFLLWILMPCLTIMLRSNNLTYLHIERLISWWGGLEMCDRLFAAKSMHCSGWFLHCGRCPAMGMRAS